MECLLDTQIVLWSIAGQQGTMTAAALAVVSDPTNTFYVSIASLWEATIKSAKGKLTIPGGGIEALVNRLAEVGVHTLPITPRHLVVLQTLPLLHGDPFDRIIVAQAKAEDMRLVTTDGLLRKYHPTAIH